MKTSSPIILSMIASVGVHAGFVMVSNNESTITLPGSTGSVMLVQVKKSNRYNAIKKQSPKERNASKTPTLQKTTSDVEDRKQSGKIEISSVSKKTSKSKARVASIIYKELNQYFTYPRLAIKRNWQGKVLLSLRVTSSGKIKNIKLNSSSGYDILDQAAINSLSKVDYLPEISTWLPFDIDLEFPVVYKLIEG